MKQYYVLYPGPVVCHRSGQTYYMGASTLARLFGVDIQDCVVFDPDPDSRLKDYDICVHLHPQYDEEMAQPAVLALSHTHSIKHPLGANRSASAAAGTQARTCAGSWDAGAIKS